MNLKKEYIPLNIPFLNGKEKKYTLQCFKDNWLSSAGPYISEFENKFAKYLGVKYAVACASGTSSLHLALKSLDIAEGDLVLVSNLTFIATVNVIRYINAVPVLVDADLDTWQIDVKVLEKFLNEECIIKNKKCFHAISGKRLSCLLITHILGNACDLKQLKRIAREYNILIVEDAAEALGAKFKGKFLGTHGALGCFSFNGNKVITTGSGGMLVTNSRRYASLAKHLSQQAKVNNNYFVHSDIGFNYRMSNVQAAIGLAQLEDLNYRLQRKKSIYLRYKKSFSSINGISFPVETDNSQSSFWLTTIKINKNLIKPSIAVIQKRLSKNNIETRSLWEPMNLSVPHRKALYIGRKNSKDLYSTCISLPSSIGLTNNQQKKVIKEFISAIKC
jgi:perosamine synthetase